MRLPLTLNPQVSVMLGAMIFAGHAIAALVILPTQVHFAVKLALWLLLAASAVNCWRVLRRRSAIALTLRRDGQMDVETADGLCCQARVDKDTMVLSGLVVLQLEIPGGRRFLTLASDALDREDFRRLRLWLRWRNESAANLRI